MNLSVIIVNWHSADYLRSCLASLARHAAAAAPEIIVIDGGSYDGCSGMLEREFPSVRFIQSPHNLGFARCNNLAAQSANGRALLFLNPDTELTEDSLSVLTAALEQSKDGGAAGCRLLNRDGSLQESCVQAFPTLMNQVLDSDWLRARWPDSPLWGVQALRSAGAQASPVEAVSGACLLVKRETFLRVGGFSEEYFMYGEDLDLCFKIRAAGQKVYHVPGTSVRHFGGGSSARAAGNFSIVMMRSSVYRFFRLRRGRIAAECYRVGMGVSALARIVCIAPLVWRGSAAVRHGWGSLRKWSAILKWSLQGPSGKGA